MCGNSGSSWTISYAAATAFEWVVHPLAVILSQDCDLDWDHKARSEGKPDDPKRLPGVLFCEVVTAETLRGRADINSGLWQRIRANKDERYQFLQEIPAGHDATGQGLPELGIDFKRLFTLPTDDVYFQLQTGEAGRRAVLVSPYLEHLSHRFSNFLSRVALPAGP